MDTKILTMLSMDEMAVGHFDTVTYVCVNVLDFNVQLYSGLSLFFIGSAVVLAYILDSIHSRFGRVLGPTFSRFSLQRFNHILGISVCSLGESCTYIKLCIFFFCRYFED